MESIVFQSIRLSKSFDRSRENDNSFDDRECSPMQDWIEVGRRVLLLRSQEKAPPLLTDQWALSDCRYVLWPRPISREGYNPPLVGVIRLGSILHSPYSPSGWLHLRLPCPLTRCRTLIECEATPGERRERKEFSWLFSPEGLYFPMGKLGGQRNVD